jgi:two-component system, LuxR family, response regulator FixJ
MKIAEQTVHLMDHDRERCEQVALLLELAGYRVKIFSSHRDILDSVSTLEPGCLLLNPRFSENGDIALGYQFLALGNLDLPIVLLTSSEDFPTLLEATLGGAVDSQALHTSPESLLPLVEMALFRDRQRRASLVIEQKITRRFNTLTPREQSVMALTIQGQSNKEIARHLDISMRTVESHRSKMMIKMQANHLAELGRLSTLVFGVDQDAAGKGDAKNR